jgi:hypothetical protein
MSGTTEHGQKKEKSPCQKDGMPGLLQNERQRISAAQLILAGIPV